MTHSLNEYEDQRIYLHNCLRLFRNNCKTLKILFHWNVSVECRRSDNFSHVFQLNSSVKFSWKWKRSTDTDSDEMKGYAVENFSTWGENILLGNLHYIKHRDGRNPLRKTPRWLLRRLHWKCMRLEYSWIKICWSKMSHSTHSTHSPFVNVNNQKSLTVNNVLLFLFNLT